MAAGRGGCCVIVERYGFGGFVTNRPHGSSYTYYDRNNDGKVDFELHRLPGGSDTDWALCDTQFRGRYDLRIGHNLLEKKPVDIPVATNVPITPGPPPISEIK